MVVPTYNEARGIEEFLERAAAALGELALPAELILVDDDSPDGTADTAERFGGGLPLDLRVLRRRGVRSLSHSVLEGIDAARYECVVVLDADLSHDPEEIGRVVSPVLSGRSDIAVGSRYVPGGVVSAWPLRRRLLSALGTSAARRLTGLRDPLSGFFACRRAAVLGRRGALRPRGYKILLEILARSGRLRVAEVPIRFRDRTSGESKLGLRAAFEFLLQLLSLASACLGSVAREARSRDPTPREASVRLTVSSRKPFDSEPVP